MSQTITAQHCKDEIVRLHVFFEDWFTGRVDRSQVEWGRVANALDSNFHIVSPNGTLTCRDDLLKKLEAAYGSYPPCFQIEIRNVKVLHQPQQTLQQEQDQQQDSEKTISDGNNHSMWLVVYEEWQNTGVTETTRMSTVWLNETNNDGYNGLKWIHVHETWAANENAGLRS